MSHDASGDAPADTDDALAEAAAQAAIVRLMAHCFLTRLGVRAFVEYALRATAASLRWRSADASLEDWGAVLGRLVRDVVAGPTDLVLWCKGDMALTPTATEAHVLTWFTFFTPSPRSAGATLEPYLAMPLPYLALTGQRAALLAFYEVFGHAPTVWRVRSTMSVQADFTFSACSPTTLDTIRRLYPRVYVVVELFRSLVHALRLKVPHAKHLAEAQGMREAVEALDALTPRFEADHFYAHLKALLQHGMDRSLIALEDDLDHLAHNVWTTAVQPAFRALRASAYSTGDAIDGPHVWQRPPERVPPLHWYYEEVLPTLSHVDADLWLNG